MVNSSAAASPSHLRGRNRSWHGESVGGSKRLCVRPSALGKLSSEIDFAFRPLASNDQHPASAEDRPLSDKSSYPSKSESIQSGDYVAAIQLGKRARHPPPGDNLITSDTSRESPARLVQADTKGTGHETRLVWDLHDLRQQLQSLRDLKRALETRLLYRSIATKDAVFKVANEYFAMFQDGFEHGPRAAHHDAFLRSVVDRDVVTCSQLRGVDALLEQWRRYADLFALRDYKLRSMHATALDDTPIVLIECGYHVFITRRTLEQLFPHVLGDPYLVQRVVGQKLACDSRVTFTFRRDGTILRYDDDSDFVAAFGRLLRNAHDLSVLMSADHRMQCHWRAQGQWGCSATRDCHCPAQQHHLKWRRRRTRNARRSGRGRCHRRRQGLLDSVGLRRRVIRRLPLDDTNATLCPMTCPHSHYTDTLGRSAQTKLASSRQASSWPQRRVAFSARSLLFQ